MMEKFRHRQTRVGHKDIREGIPEGNSKDHRFARHIFIKIEISSIRESITDGACLGGEGDGITDQEEKKCLASPPTQPAGHQKSCEKEEDIRAVGEGY